MFLIYADETGQPHYQDNTPICIISGLIFHDQQIRKFSEEVRSLGQRIFNLKWSQFVEKKGTDLLKPSAADNRRNIAFVKGVLNNVNRYKGLIFAYGINKLNCIDRNKKYPGSDYKLPHGNWVFPTIFQFMANDIHKYLTEVDGRGENAHIIYDFIDVSIMNLILQQQAQYLLGNVEGMMLTRIADVPSFLISRYCQCMVAADIAGTIIYGQAYRQRARHHPDSMKVDYFYMSGYWKMIQERVYNADGDNIRLLGD